MKKGGILNAHLSAALARLGHTDLVVICDAGLPIPPGPEVVDLAFRFGVPPFETVLSGLLEELVIEGAVIALETEDTNPEVHGLLKERFPAPEIVPHEEIKKMVVGAKLVVRTGEATPYSNVIVRCGVPF